MRPEPPRSRLHARDLFALLVRHFSRRPAEPRCLIRLDVLTPSGKAAVKVLGASRLATPAPNNVVPLRAQG